jgi:hypothetical protein
MAVDVSQLLAIAQTVNRTPLSESTMRKRTDIGQLRVIGIGGSIFVEETELREHGKLYLRAST